MAVLAICDDTQKDAEKVISIIQQYNEQMKSLQKYEPLSIMTFVGGEELLFKMEDQDMADIYLLDIEMPKMNGLELAKRIKEVKPNVMIIFVTRFLNYSQQGYEYGFRYVNKDNIEKELPQALHAAFENIRKETYTHIELTADYKKIYVPIPDIQYIERQNKTIQIYTRNNGLIEEGDIGLNKLYKQLNSKRFIMIDRGRIVNIDYISEVCNDKLIIYVFSENEQKEVYMSRRRRADVKREITQYWAKRHS